MRKLRIWIKAHFTSRRLWRVTYEGEPRRTRLLSKVEAQGLAECFRGTAWIDYGITTTNQN